MSFTTSGIFSGTPTTAGTFVFEIRATDATGATGSHSYSVIVNEAPPVTITLSPEALNPSTVMVGTSVAQDFTASGGVAPYSFVLVSGTLPPGVSFSSLGKFGGTPSTAGTYTFTVRAKRTAALSPAPSSAR